MIRQFNQIHIIALIILQDQFSYFLIHPVPLKWYLSDFLTTSHFPCVLHAYPLSDINPISLVAH